MAIPAFIQVYLPSYDVTKLDEKNPAVAREVITSVLNEGNTQALEWIFHYYSLDEIRECIKKPQRGVWFAESLNYWRQILRVDEILHYRDAILYIYPS